MANCWWGENSEGRRIHWAKWEHLTNAKEAGGLEFKSLESENDALLAKQLWRLITEPDLLLSRVLKGRYFPHQDLLSVEQKPNDSWVWKSRLGAKNILKKGLGWKVPDDHSIKVWEDNWLPKSIGSKPLSRRPDDCPIIRVQQLINERNRCWKQTLIKQTFIPEDAQQIMQLPIRVEGGKDEPVWYPEKHGSFSVKSAYSLIQQVQEGKRSDAETSHEREDRRKMWKRVWKLSVKMKLKHFLWKCIHSWLPTNEAVRKRGVKCDTICRRCEMSSESKEHIFFQCPESMFVWKLAPISWEHFSHLIGNFEDWWNMICTAELDQNGQKGMEFSVYLLWQIWKARNTCQFQGLLTPTEEVVQKALKEWQEFDDIQVAENSNRNPKSRQGAGRDDACAATPRTIIINVASELQSAVEGARLGMIFRDEQDRIVLAQTERCMNTPEPGMAEMETV